ncbi:MAG: PilZ domain-containing protein [Candidatus Omnitrophota bacterium]
MKGYNAEDKRRSERIRGGLKATILGRHIQSHIPVIDISCHGALLAAARYMNVGETIDITLHLPFTHCSIKIKGRIARTAPNYTKYSNYSYSVALEFSSLLHSQREVLLTAIHDLKLAN